MSTFIRAPPRIRSQVWPIAANWSDSTRAFSRSTENTKRLLAWPSATWIISSRSMTGTAIRPVMTSSSKQRLYSRITRMTAIWLHAMVARNLCCYLPTAVSRPQRNAPDNPRPTWRIRDWSLGGCCATASFGVTQAQPGDSVETMLRRADRALYLAKNAGRNLVIQLGGEPRIRNQFAVGPSETQSALHVRKHLWCRTWRHRAR